MLNIVHRFSNDTMSNDEKVFKFVKNHFNVMAKGSSVKHDQSSKKIVRKSL